jgi:DNA-3-methyladenine glycosylase
MANIKTLHVSFYQRKNVLQVARDLLGKIIYTNWDGKITAARIVETEAYAGAMDAASHAYGGKRTKRNDIMYANGGAAYVYLCYGIHHLFNVVTNVEGIPHAVLIRGGEPVKGINEMLKRTGKLKLDNTLTRGPGNFSKALGIHTSQSGISLFEKKLFIADDGIKYAKEQVGTSPRIGVDYAGEDALLPYRFYVKGNPYVSGKPNK